MVASLLRSPVIDSWTPMYIDIYIYIHTYVHIHAYMYVYKHIYISPYILHLIYTQSPGTHYTANWASRNSWAETFCKLGGNGSADLMTCFTKGTHGSRLPSSATNRQPWPLLLPGTCTSPKTPYSGASQFIKTSQNQVLEP